MEDLRKVDILYIHPTKNLSTTQYPIIPIGVFALLNLLISKGNSVMGINNGIEIALNPAYNLINDLKKIDYKILLIDLHWYEHSYSAIEIARLAKEIHPDSAVIIGGITTTIFAQEIIENFNCIDYAIKGDSELPLIMLADYLLNKSGQPGAIPNICYKEESGTINKEITYCCSDLDKLDFISNSFLKNSEYYYFTNSSKIDTNMPKSAWLSIGRGCIYDCSYCDASAQNTCRLFGRDKIIYRSNKAIAQDIQKLVTEKGIKLIKLTHDLEMFGPDFYQDLFHTLRRNKVKPGINYDCLQLPSKGFIEELKTTFAEDLIMVEITPLSADENIRALHGKNFTNKDLFDILSRMAEQKMVCKIYYTVNVPLEPPDCIQKNLEQMEKILRIYPADLLTIIYHNMVLDPLATMKKEGKFKITPHLNSFMDYYHYCLSNDEHNYGYSDSSSHAYFDKLSKYDSFRAKMKAVGFMNLF